MQAEFDVVLAAEYNGYMENIPQKSGYGKRPLWQWIVLYLVVGAVAYAAIYYFVFAKRGGYDSNSSTENSSPYYNTK